MILRRLVLRNIRSYEELDLAFDEGITLLSGDIGSGKSTVLQAIEFSLFGTQRTTLEGESLVRHGADEAVVSLTFHLGEHEYTTSRTLKRGANGVRQTEASLTTDGVTESLSTQELKAKVLQLLGYPDALLTKSKGLIFRHTVYTPQEAMKAIIFLPLEERLNTLRVLFGIERYKLVKENAQHVLRELRARERVEGAHAHQVAQLEREAQTASETAIAALSAVEKTQRELETLTTALRASRELLAEKRSAYETQLTFEKDRAALMQRTRELERAQRNTRDDLARIEEYLAVKLEVVADASEALDETRKEQLATERELQLVTRELASLGAKKTIHADQARSIITLATCPVCQQTVTEEHKHDVQKQSDHAISALTNRIVELESRERTLQATAQTLAKRFTQLSEQQRRYSVSQRDVLQRAQQAAQRELLLERQATNAREAQEATEKLETIALPDPAVRDAYRAAEKLALERERARDEANARLAHAQSVESAARTQAAVLVERLGKAHAAANEVARLQAQRQWLEEHFLAAITVVERHVLASLHAEFGELFTTLFTKLVEDESIAVGLGESFEPLITQNGYDAALEQLSGGEKTAVALSYRLGLYKVISDFASTIQTRDLLILDEPTDGFSTEQLHRVRDVLRGLGCRQILLVSHEQQMEGACDHVIRITKRLHRSAADAAT